MYKGGVVHIYKRENTYETWLFITIYTYDCGIIADFLHPHT